MGISAEPDQVHFASEYYRSSLKPQGCWDADFLSFNPSSGWIVDLDTSLLPPFLPFLNYCALIFFSLSSFQKNFRVKTIIEGCFKKVWGQEVSFISSSQNFNLSNLCVFVPPFLHVYKEKPKDDWAKWLLLQCLSSDIGGEAEGWVYVLSRCVGNKRRVTAEGVCVSRENDYLS